MGKLGKARQKKNLSAKTQERLATLYRIWKESHGIGERDKARAEMERIAAEHGYTIEEVDPIIEAYLQAMGWNPAGPAASSDPPPSLAETIAALRGIILQYVVLPEHADLIIALWAAHSYVYRRFMHAPRLVADSPDPGFGKTTLLDLLANVCRNAERSDDLSPASVWEHLAAMYGDATVLMDEADGYDFQSNVGLVKIFNGGHRRGGYVWRMRQGQRVKFPIFAPMAAAAIDARGKFTRAMTERSIIITMPLATRAQSRELRRLDLESESVLEEFAAVRMALSAWSRDPQLDTNPELPRELHNRVADSFRPLVSVADAASPELGELARQVAVAKQSLAHAFEGLGHGDCRKVIAGRPHISSVDPVRRAAGIGGREFRVRTVRRLCYRNSLILHTCVRV